MERYFNKEGKPISLEEGRRRFDDLEYKIIQKTTVAGNSVSTVWLGQDQAWGRDPPLIFETMVFEAETYEIDDEFIRHYSTLSQAKLGHEETVRKVQEKYEGKPREEANDRSRT